MPARVENGAIRCQKGMLHVHMRVDAPGIMILPLASMTRTPSLSGSVPHDVTAAMVSPLMATSQRTTPSGVTTSPPRRMRSSIGCLRVCRSLPQPGAAAKAPKAWRRGGRFVPGPAPIGETARPVATPATGHWQRAPTLAGCARDQPSPGRGSGCKSRCRPTALPHCRRRRARVSVAANVRR